MLSRNKHPDSCLPEESRNIKFGNIAWPRWFATPLDSLPIVAPRASRNCLLIMIFLNIQLFGCSYAWLVCRSRKIVLPFHREYLG